MNYGVGGHYTVHHDYIDKGLINNRIATFLVYLKDVPQGKFMSVSVPMIYMTLNLMFIINFHRVILFLICVL